MDGQEDCWKVSLSHRLNRVPVSKLTFLMLIKSDYIKSKRAGKIDFDGGMGIKIGGQKKGS